MKKLILFIFLSVTLLAGEQDPWRFIMYGDTRSGIERHKQIISKIQEKPFDFIINSGDMVVTGSRHDLWAKFMSIIEPVNNHSKENPSYLGVIGNHDLYLEGIRHSKDYKNWHHYMSWLPGNGEYYVYDHKNIRFIILDSNPKDLSEQADSLESWLKNNTKEWVIVQFHYPTYPFGVKKLHKTTMQAFWPIIYKYKVDLVVNGHAHHYVRSKPLKPLTESPYAVYDSENGIVQIISGGGGASLKTVKKDRQSETYFDSLIAASNDTDHHFIECNVSNGRIDFSVISKNGNIIDSFFLEK